MCGIGLVLLSRDGAPDGASAPAGRVPAARLRRRGPDAAHEVTMHAARADGFELRLTGTVLHLRGGKVVPQPVRDANCNALLWNGEVFGQGPGGGVAVAPGQSDTEQLLVVLGSGSRAVPEVMDGVQGPWAFAYWHEQTRTLWYGRDPLGRRSLLRLRVELAGGWCALVLSSVTLSALELGELLSATEVPLSHGRSAASALSSLVWEELPADGLGCVHVDRLGRASSTWSQRGPLYGEPALYSAPAALIQAEDVCQGQAAAMGLLRVLSNSVRRRVQDVPPRSLADRAAGADGRVSHARVGVLFSGGIDSMVLARLADLHLPAGEPIDLINVAFGDAAASAPDRLGGILGARELCAISDRPFRLVCVDISLEELQRDRAQLTTLLCPANTVMDLNIGSALWYGARGQGRLADLGPLNAAPLTKADACRYASSMPIPATISLASAPRTEGWSDVSPATGVQLRLRFNGGAEVRKSVSLSIELLAPQHQRCGHASGGGDSQSGSSDPSAETKERSQDYCSTARVLLLGMGADEQMGGYGRHRTVYRQEGWDALAQELHAERERLWLRNLGRDDRVVSDWGREARHPFLDEEVMAFIARTPLPLLCNLERGYGEGDKQILRRAARLLGLTYSSYLQKRAIQFGTRIANKNVCGKATLDDAMDLADLVHPRADASRAPRATKDDLHKKRKAWGPTRAAGSTP